MAEQGPEVATKAPRVDYAAAEKQLHDLRRDIPTDQLAVMSYNGFLVAQDELTEVIRRLGDRRQDMDELLSIAKSLEVLARKVARLSKRLAPELREDSDVQ